MESVILTQPEVSFEQYLTYDDGTDNCYELVNGVLEQMPPARGIHFKISHFLQFIFQTEAIRLSRHWKVYADMIGVRTGLKSSRIPDVVIITAAQEEEILNKSAIVDTPPLLAVEVVSPDDAQRDYQAKKNEYERIGIPEYWIVDPIERQVLVLILKEKQYLQNIYKNDEVVNSLTFPELKISVNQIIEAKLYGGEK